LSQSAPENSISFRHPAPTGSGLPERNLQTRSSAPPDSRPRPWWLVRPAGRDREHGGYLDFETHVKQWHHEIPARRAHGRWSISRGATHRRVRPANCCWHVTRPCCILRS